jgi:hypothetical protein
VTGGAKRVKGARGKEWEKDMVCLMLGTKRVKAGENWNKKENCIYLAIRDKKAKKININEFELL